MVLELSLQLYFLFDLCLSGDGLAGPSPEWPGHDVSRLDAALRAAGWIADGALLVVESGRDEVVEGLGTLLDDRVHGAARIGVWAGYTNPSID